MRCLLKVEEMFMELLSNHKVAESYDFEKNNEMIDFTSLTIGSNKKVWWKCDLGHSWEATIKSQTKGKSQKCPYCSNRLILQGFNDLATTHSNLLSEWHYEKNNKLELFPESLIFKSSIKVWWKCKINHEWNAAINNRTRPRATSCPYCSGNLPIIGKTDLGTVHPELSKEWHPTKNELTPQDFLSGSEKIAWWIGECGHEWDTAIAQRAINGFGCPYCSGKRVLQGFNDLTITAPEILNEWNYEKNFLKPTEVSKGSSKRVWWVCSNNHEWEAKIDNRVNGYNKCPECDGFFFKNPKLAAEVHPLKNTAEKVRVLSTNSHKKIWWICNQGHSYDASVANRSKGKGCPYCAGRKIHKGFNDLKTVNKILAGEWNHVKNSPLTPENITVGSNRKVWWKCDKEHEWISTVNDRTRGNSCPECAVGLTISEGEKEIYQHLLQYIDEKDIITNTRKLIPPFELDIYIPEKKIAIEFNGVYWHSEKAGIEKNYHYDKWKQCQEKGIQLITIWEDDWRTKKELIKQMLSRKIGFSQQEKIYARKTVIKNINKKEADEFLDQNHIQGSVDGSTRLGLYTKDTDMLIAVILFKKRNETEAELVRYATSKIVIGGFTKLLKHFEKTQQNIEKITTFADHTVSNGGLYENHGFINDYELKPDYSYVVKNSRVHKFNYRLKRFRNDPELKWEEGLSERELAQLNNIYRIYDCGKTKYVKILNNTEL